MSESKAGCLPIIGVVLAIGFVANTCSGGDSGGGGEYGAESTCEDWVKDQLKAPATADFNDTSVSGSGPWTVTGTVDAENGFGANLRVAWTCDIRLDSDDYYRGSATLLE